MEAKLLVLAFMASIALSFGLRQTFFTRNPVHTLPAQHKVCSGPIKGFKTLIMSRKCYYAFSVCGDGHILLLPYTRSKLRKYYSPKNLNSLRGLPIIAAFWSEMNTACRYNHANKVQYGQTRDGNLRNRVKAIVNDQHFNPYMVVWARYINMRPKHGSQNNDFQILLSSGSGSTYAIFIYNQMTWNRYCRWCPRPIVGYTNGKGYGYQYRLPRQSAHHHLRYSVKVFRISDAQPRMFKPQEVTDQESVASLEEALSNVQKYDTDQNEVNINQDEDPIPDDDDDVVFTSQDEEDDGDDDGASVNDAGTSVNDAGASVNDAVNNKF